MLATGTFKTPSFLAPTMGKRQVVASPRFKAKLAHQGFPLVSVSIGSRPDFENDKVAEFVNQHFFENITIMNDIWVELDQKMARNRNARPRPHFWIPHNANGT